MMTDREFDAIRELITVLRSDFGAVAKVLAAMIERGFTAEETQFAINEISKRHPPIETVTEEKRNE